MTFVLICIIALAVLGIVAALASMLTKGGTDAPVVEAHDCTSCNSIASGECKIGCVIERQREKLRVGDQGSGMDASAGMEKKRLKGNNSDL